LSFRKIELLNCRMHFFTSSKKIEVEISKRVTDTCDLILSEIGAELHDDLIQKLTVFRLLIDRLEKSSSEKVEVEAISIKMISEFEQVILAVRNISRQLLPAPSEGDSFVDRIEVLCQNMQRAGTSHIHFKSSGFYRSLNPVAERHLSRIIQELINNAFKHSSAWHIWIRLTWEKEKLVLEVEDDGSGFSKIPEFINRLTRKQNTLRMRVNIIGASITYNQGVKGLLAKVELNYDHEKKSE
jgi:signal transduction histidine kinase